ncbi:MAG: insulinase family protein [Bacteroidia bacterium]|nr:insulinase family protein [Bacteroidia bacterium]
MKSIRLLCVLVMIVTLRQQVVAQSLPKIEFEKYTLANGLQVILCVNRSIPAVNVNLWYHVGSKNEEQGKSGFAHLFEHMMFQGSKHVQGEYLALIERAGANLRTGGVNGTTNEDRTNYFQTVPTSSLEYALWMESDRMGFLDDVLTQESFANQQDVVKNEKRQGDNAPYSAVQYLVAEHLYPFGHPYAHTVIGSITDLTNATLDDVREFFNTWYVPNNCSLTLCGDFDPDVAKRLIRKYFGPIPAGKPLSRPGVNIPVLPSTKRVHATDRVPAARVEFVYAVPQQYSPEEAPLDAAAEILGQGKNSLLFRRLVSELKLANNVRVRNTSREIAGQFHIIVTASEGADLGRITTEIDEQIQAFAKQGSTSEDLLRFKAGAAMQFISGLERIGGFGGIADRLNGYNTYLGTPDYFQQDYDRYQQVSADAVKRDFRTWIADAHRLEVIITPETSSRPDAEEFDRSIPPSTEGPVVFQSPVVERTSLDNGLEVVVSRRGQLPLFSARLLLKTQDQLETADKAGCSALTADMLDEGTAKRNAIRIKEDLDRIGASLSVNGSKMSAAVSLRTLAQYRDEAMEIFSDVILNPAFPEQEFDRVRRQSIDDVRRGKNDPSTLASRLLATLLFGKEHPLGIPANGSETSLSALTTDDLRRTWGTFWRPNNAVLVFVGDITLEQAVSLAKKYLGEWKAADLPTQTLPTLVAPPAHTIYLCDRPSAPQSEIRIGSVAPDRFSPDYHLLQLTNALLGGAFSSRLNLNLREDKGYTYGAFSRVGAGKGYGSWLATAGVQSAYTREALFEFRKEIEGMSGTIPVTEDELRNMKNNLMRGYTQNFESNEMVLGQLASLLSFDLPLSELDTYLSETSAQTVPRVTEAAQRHLRFNHAITVVVGDLAVTEAAVKELAWGSAYVVDDEGRVLRQVR